MKIFLTILPMTLLSLNSCGTIEQMTCLINESTEAISCNSQAIERDTAAICNNVAIITASTETIKENHHQLEKASE